MVCSISVSSAFLKTDFEVAKCRKTIGLLNQSLLLQRSKILSDIFHVGPCLEYRPIIFLNARKTDKTALENVQFTFITHILDPSTVVTFN